MHRTTVFTNGCFDLLHYGHIHILEACRFSADAYGNSYVVVGLNSDKSVRALKGNSRPIISEEYRRLMLLSTKYVDKVIIFDEPECSMLIREVSPEIYVKADDYTIDNMDKYELIALEEVGSKIVFAPKFNCPSTTDIIENAHRAYELGLSLIRWGK